MFDCSFCYVGDVVSGFERGFDDSCYIFVCFYGIDRGVFFGAAVQDDEREGMEEGGALDGYFISGNRVRYLFLFKFLYLGQSEQRGSSFFDHDFVVADVVLHLITAGLSGVLFRVQKAAFSASSTDKSNSSSSTGTALVYECVFVVS